MAVLPPSRRRPISSARMLDALDLFPAQGEWDETAFLELSGRTNRLIELSDGYLEVLPMPGKSHQRIAVFLFNLLREHVEGSGLGEVLIAPYPIRLWPGKVREPDIVVALGTKADQLGEEIGDAPDLVVEVLSKDRQRDLVVKRREYAKAGIREYWLIDPRNRQFTVLSLTGRTYSVYGEFHVGDEAKSKLLGGWSASTASIFEAGASPE